MSFFTFRNYPERPRTKPETGPIDWLLELFALALMLFFVGYFFYYYPHLPVTIPSHFNGSGEPDDYSNKSTLWMLPGIALFIYLLLTLIAMAPHRLNLPGKITPENALRQYTLALRLIRYLKMLMMGLFFYIFYSTVQIATHAAAGLGAWFMPLFLGFIFVPIIIYIILARRKN